MADEDEVDGALVEVAPTANVARLQRWVHDAGGTVRSWTVETRLMGIELLAASATLPLSTAWTTSRWVADTLHSVQKEHISGLIWGCPRVADL